MKRSILTAIEDLRGVKIALLGWGVENQALASFLLENGITDLTILDQNKIIPQKLNGLKYKLGKDYLKNIVQFGVIFRTPGISIKQPPILQALKHGVVVSSQTNLFFELCPAHIIGVTGTKGKGTTSTLIYECLKRAGFSTYLAGNIGVPPISFLAHLQPSDWVVLELSSFQLEDFKRAPEIAVVLEISSDHIDFHKSAQEYVKAKANLLRHQGARDQAILNADYLTTVELGASTLAKKYFFSRRKAVDQGAFIRWRGKRGESRWGELILRLSGKDQSVLKTYDLHLRGEHNLENVAAAALAAYLAGAKIASIRRALHAFRGLPCRLELVCEKNGIHYYNDSLATTPNAVIAALGSFSQPVILIVGGKSKGVSYVELGEYLASARNLKSLVLLGENKAELKLALGAHPSLAKAEASSMDEAVHLARKSAVAGDIILLSPGAASFDMFHDYKERAQRFVEAVERLEQ